MVGVLALQGDVVEHLRALQRAGARTHQVRTPADLKAVEAVFAKGPEEH